jgi:hypothetical protein
MHLKKAQFSLKKIMINFLQEKDKLMEIKNDEIIQKHVFFSLEFATL